MFDKPSIEYDWDKAKDIEIFVWQITMTPSPLAEAEGKTQRFSATVVWKFEKIYGNAVGKDKNKGSVTLRPSYGFVAKPGDPVPPEKVLLTPMAAINQPKPPKAEKPPRR